MDKFCSKCETLKDIDMFWRHSRNRDGRQYYCKDCTRDSRIKSPAKSSARKSSVRKYNLKNRYNLSVEQYEQMMTEQNGVCAGCLRECNRGRLCVDHDRSCCAGDKSCGECIRVLLCRKCNLALGSVEDNIETLSRLIQILEKNKLNNIDA